MASRGTVSLPDIEAMLSDCMPGHTMVKKKHRYLIHWKGKDFGRLPLGEHGKRTRVEIEVGHIRALARAFDITDCAAKHFPHVFRKFRKRQEGKAGERPAAEGELEA
jgi:hypothetical protein